MKNYQALTYVWGMNLKPDSVFDYAFIQLLCKM